MSKKIKESKPALSKLLKNKIKISEINNVLFSGSREKICEIPKTCRQADFLAALKTKY